MLLGDLWAVDAALLVYRSNEWCRVRQIAITVVFWPNKLWTSIILRTLHFVDIIS
jgi:hypothetical protein